MASILAFTSTSVLAQVNSWINPVSGNWQDATSWSLGVLPANSQSVMITNSGFKAVAINPSTPINFPGSMTVSSLTIQSPTNSKNTLLLNFFGTAVPLTVLNGLTLQDNAQILNFNSGLVVQSGTVTVTNSQINQDGGFINTTGAQMNLSDSVYNLTNGDFEGGSVSLGFPVSAQFNQYGGTVLITNLVFGVSTFGTASAGTYALYGGILNLPGGLTLLGEDDSFTIYLQAGGTNQTTHVMMEPGILGISPSFTLNGGLLADNDVSIVADYYGTATLTQNGGTHVVTNGVSLAGAARGIAEARPGTYQLNGGMLTAGSVSMDSAAGTAAFNQTNGIAQVGEIQAQPASGQAYFVSAVNLSGGTLACSNLSISDGGDILQTGGELVVSNSLAFSGFVEPGPRFYSTYTLMAGTLIASNISVGGIWIFGNSSTNRISNPGTCSLSNTIVMSNAVEQLGRFILPTNAIIYLAGSASRLSFANSSGETWAGGATLVISNWNGNLFGGGADQLFFGSDNSGLTSQQLSQVQFINPAGLTNGTYSAQILSDGEVVPAGGSSSSGLVNSWIRPTSGNWQDATSWSLGVLPNISQSVFITNAGFKAVQINSSTATNFPGSMSVSNLIIRSAANGFNTLLMNFVGAGNPLVVGVDSNSPGNLVIGDTNSAMVMLSSGLIVNQAPGPNYAGSFEVDGTFIQSDNSEVVATIIGISGKYYLTNGMVFINEQGVGGTFNQQGGTNFGNVLINDGGEYDLIGGRLEGSVGLDLPYAGVFNQSGGTNISGLGLFGPGVYRLSGGLLVPGDLQVGPSTLSPGSLGAGAVEQTGGTDTAGNITMGVGNYSLEGGVLTASNLSLPSVSDRLGSFGSIFDQSGGFFSSGGVTMNGVFDLRNGLLPSTYTLSGGELVTPTINMTMGLVDQTGGSNSAGVITLNSLSSYVLNGGVLIASNLTQNGQTAFSLVGSIQQSGGTNQVLGALFVGGSSSYDFTNGLLIANNIQVAGQANFVHAGGSFGGLKNVLLAGGGWVERTVGEQLGQFQLGTNSSSTLNLPSGSCVLRFTNSSSVSWDSGGRLTIQNWSGSLSGGGSQQLFFGTSASGLTAQQLSQVQFSNPAGLPGGTYSARILSSGEVVPNQIISARIAFSQQGNNLLLTWPTGWTLQSATNVLGAYSDVAGATSPFTNNVTLKPKQFFRLRQ
jgi:hypothetical protein